jgi:hypothetical protein
MKNILFFSLFVLLIACKKEITKPALPEDYYGTASAERNGKPWSAHPTCWIDVIGQSNLVVQLDSFWQDFYFKEQVSIYGIPPILGTYKVYKLSTQTVDKLYSVLSMWDADQPLGGYTILESDSSTNLVTLTKYDTLTKEIKGTFNLTFVVSGRPYPSYPDTIKMKNGQFFGKLIKK